MWKSSDEAVATVSASGNSASINAVAPGSATISVSADGKSAEVAITVIPQGYATISLGKTELTLAPGETAKLSATCTPENVKDKTLQWSSSDNAIATVDSEGTVTAKAVGAATITVKSASGEGQATCAVTVAENVVSVESVAITPDGATLNIGEEAAFAVKVTPADATYADQVEWKISDASVAELTATGGAAKVKALAAGTAELTATVEGKSAKVIITVNPAAPAVPEGFVDMGLPSGTIWAKENLGTDSANPVGQYYAWGEVETKTEYTDKNYSFNDFDGLSLLEPEDDAATALLGDGFRMPTLGEFAELLNPANCTWEWTEQAGHNGYLVTSLKNGNSLFLPAAGIQWSTNINFGNTKLFYWTATKDATSDNYGVYRLTSADLLDAENHDISFGQSYAYYGCPVRPVYAPCPNVQVTGITANPDHVQVARGKTCQLNATVEPASAPQQIVWITYYPNLKLNMHSGEAQILYGNGGEVHAVDGTHGFSTTVTLEVSPSYPEPQAVDLGFKSGTLWASWDLGASAPEEPGYYFAWGETTPKLFFSEENYKWYDPENKVFTKYDENDPFLEDEDDAAAVNLGGQWRIPTRADVQELIEKTTMQETTVNGMKGQLVTGPNGNSIFLPYGGHCINAIMGYNYAFSYWTDEAQADDKVWEFSQNQLSPRWRDFGLCIRPVISGHKSPAAQVRALGPVSPVAKNRNAFTPPVNRADRERGRASQGRPTSHRLQNRGHRK